jgi:HD-GYP domain-containing protein (c-di-GMP phosphodiesterase class II)
MPSPTTAARPQILERWLTPAVDRLADDLRRHHQATADHSHRLADAARRVSERLGLDPLEATESELVAILHDVGKLAVPPELLDRHGELRAEERRLLRSHAVAGAGMLARRAGLEHLAQPVRHVHEAWDGTGYPDGLAGEAIPRLARIVCVVDAYDAMTHDRAYRRALSPHEARMRLALGAGRQFDPAIARAYLADLHDEGERRFRREPPSVDPPAPVV